MFSALRSDRAFSSLERFSTLASTLKSASLLNSAGSVDYACLYAYQQASYFETPESKKDFEDRVPGQGLLPV